MTIRLSRRKLLAWAAGSAALSACEVPMKMVTPAKLPEQIPTDRVPTVSPYSDSMDALFDTLLPAERNEKGDFISAGARETGVDTVLETERFARLLVEQGFLMSLPEAVMVGLDDLTGVTRTTLNRALDARASLEKPLAKFSELSLASREVVVAHLFEDDATKPLMIVARAACNIAYLGAITSDVGLQQVGFPPFEKFSDGLANSGYPRMINGVLEDYTLNRAPTPTVGDDLSTVINSDGDLK